MKGSYESVTMEGRNAFDSRAATQDGSGLLLHENGRYEVMGDGGLQRVVVQNLPEEQVFEGPWEVRFPHSWGAPSTVELAELISWSKHPNETIRHFSGIAAYHKTFGLAAGVLEAGRRVLLDLGSVREVARVWVNGRDQGIAWHTPYTLDITEALKVGNNRLTIEVANVMNNRLIGEAKKPLSERRTKSNVNALPSAWGTPMEEASLLPAGLLGPVKLRFAERIPLAP
jgi:hypothetical protein